VAFLDPAIMSRRVGSEVVNGGTCQSGPHGSDYNYKPSREEEQGPGVRLPAVGTLKRYSKALEYEYRVKTAALGTLK
jgi:hypothetical protein